MTCKHIYSKEKEVLLVGTLDMPKPGYVAPSREGLVPLTVYVKPETRQALKIAAATNNTTVAEIMEEAIAAALKKFGKRRD
jgi:hypothetical protein